MPNPRRRTRESPVLSLDLGLSLLAFVIADNCRFLIRSLSTEWEGNCPFPKRSMNGLGGNRMDEHDSVASDTACWFLIVLLIAAFSFALQMGWV
jgi:hypothetical protein